jgi:integrase
LARHFVTGESPEARRELRQTITTRTRIGAATARTTKLPEGAAEMIVRDDALTGFALRLYATGGRTYVYSGRVAGSGQRRTVVLGDAAAMTAAEARAAAERHRIALRAGTDPVAARAAERQRVAAERAARVGLVEIAKEYLAAHGKGALPWQKRPPTRRGAGSEAGDVRRAMAHLGGIAVSEASAAHARALQVTVAHLAPESRKRIFGAARRVLHYASFRELRPDNPFASIKAPAGSVARSRHLTPDEVVRVWEAAGSLGGYGKAVRFLIAQPVRREIARTLRFGQIDFEVGTIAIGGEVEGNKAREAWVLPLTGIAAEIAAAQRMHKMDAATLVFPNASGRGPVGMDGTAKARLDALSAVKDWQLHDLRRTAATLTADAHPDLDEAAFDLWLMHRRRGVHGVYQVSKRLAAMRKVANLWNATLSGIIGRGDKVVVLMQALG